MGFAIPSNTVISIVNNIIRNGYVKGRAFLGITASEWSTYAAKKMILQLVSKSNLYQKKMLFQALMFR